MRIVYGVHGYGRGHATRALAVLPHLTEKHQVLVLAGGDAYRTIAPEYAVVRVPTLGFVYSVGSGARRRSNWRTFCHNTPALFDLLCHGPTFQLASEVVEEFAPDVVISDAECLSSHVAAAHRIPRISFDHISIMSYCRPVLSGRDKSTAWLDGFLYRVLMGRPDRVIVSSFFDAPVRDPRVCVVGTLVRDSVRSMSPRDGEHLLVYFNRGHDQIHDELIGSLRELDCPVRIYGASQRGRSGMIEFLPPSNLPFLEDLASCRAVISTAGNQLVGEAMYLKKPILVLPERCSEQRMNAAAVEQLGIGMQAPFHRFSARLIRGFLDRREEFVGNLRRLECDGLQEAILTIDRFLGELVPEAAENTAVRCPVSMKLAITSDSAGESTCTTGCA